ncbi:MAG TPA: HAD family hydrolase [Euzebya sp.]|nr:HAD family hydrolase [Euzebya sp.]
MASAIKAVVSDLDGTFWWGHQQMHATTLPAVLELRARGVPVLFATGRRYASARRGLAPLGLAGPAVLMSGAVGADLATGVEWLRQSFTPEWGLAVLEAFRAEALEPVVYVCDAEVDALAGPGCATNTVHLATLEDDTPTDPLPFITAGRVIGFGICGIDTAHVPATGRIATGIAGLAQAWEGPDHVMGGWSLMVGPPTVSKVDGIRAWCARQDIAPADVIAVGDGSNDVEMLDWAGTSVAVTGGAADAHGSDHLIPTPQDGGWARLLELC